MQVETTAHSVGATTRVERVDVEVSANLFYRFEREPGTELARCGVVVYRVEVEIGDDGDDLVCMQLMDAWPNDERSLRKVARRWLRGYLGTV